MPAINPNEYAYLWSPTRQMLDKNGKPLVGGYVMLDQHGTPGAEALSYSDWNGALNARRILLDSLGRASAIVENDKLYDMYVYNRYNVLMYSALGVNCTGESGGDSPMRFTSNDGSIDIYRSGNNVDFSVHKDSSTNGTATGDSVDENGLIEFDNVKGDITVIYAGSLSVDSGKMYHVTLQLEVSMSSYSDQYIDCLMVDSENTSHKFVLDGSRAKQLVDLSWDLNATHGYVRFYVRVPDNASVDDAVLYIHSVNAISVGSGIGGVTEVAHDETLTGNGTNDSPLGVAETIKQEIADKLSSVSVDGTTITGDGTPENPLVAAVQPQVNADWNATSGVAQILNKPNLATVATSGSYNDLSDKPTIPTVPVQDVEVNGSSVVDESGVAKVTVPTKTSDLTNDSGFITASQVPEQVNSDWNASSGVAQILNKPNLAAVATSGSYNDLTDKPTIPTVPVEDVRVNGTSVVSNKIADVTVPTKTSDLTNDSGFITASDIPAIPVKNVEVNGNSVVDAQGVANIDLSGYATDAELTQGLSTKQDTISDLSTIRSGAQAGATAVQDPSYVHTDNNFTNADKTKLDGIEAGAEVNDVDDVRVNGTSVVSNKIADIDVPTKTSDLTNDSGFITASDIPAQVNSDWNASSGVAQILNKPNLATVATSGSYNDLADKPTIPDVPVQDVEVNGASVVNESGVAKVTVPTKTSDLTNDSEFITASQVPAQVNSDWNASSGVAQILNKPNLATVATSGDYQDLTNKPAIPTVPVEDVRVNGTSVVGNKIADVTVPTKTSDLNNDSGFITASQVPAQVNSDWNASSGVAQILNKPNLAAVATSGDYQDLSNKPTINNVPIVTSSDDGKILKASYTGGVGSYSWETESGGTVTDVLVDGTSVVNEQGQAIIAMPTDLVPSVTSSDNGKILTATYSGGQASYVWADPQTFSQQQSDWTQTDSSAVDYIKNKPQNLALQAGTNISIVESNGAITISSTASGTITDVKVNGTSVVDSQGVAEVVVPEQQQSSWSQGDTTAVDYIKDKPSIPSIGTITL